MFFFALLIFLFNPTYLVLFTALFLNNFLNSDPKILFLPNPNQPIESSLSLNELRETAIKCKNKNCLLVIDEAYNLFGADSGLPLIKEFNNVVILRTFSKAFGVPSIRTGSKACTPSL